MDAVITLKRCRGRPPIPRDDSNIPRETLLRMGVEVLTEKGFSATGIDEILRKAKVPKGSFYHYFDSKEAFGIALIDSYASYFARKMSGFLLDTSRTPLDRIRAFVTDAKDGMARFNYERGCLVGNLGQEMGALPESFRQKLIEVFTDWQTRLGDCFLAAREAGELAAEADCRKLAAYFWIGWEGAVLRAKLERSPLPLNTFEDLFFTGLVR
ncbi:MAG: TetR/AcrR family transcriptional regulator [Rugosibacter sp.]|nr:TetR/AcrR family transcriptional regulator [Rugosibacter sp.]